MRTVGTKAIGWQTLSQVVVQVVTSMLTLTVAAVTVPHEFALWGVAGVIYNAQNLIAGLGLGQALIYFKGEERSRDAVDSAFVATGAMGVAVGGALALGAGLIAG